MPRSQSVIRTSDKGWLKDLVAVYRRRGQVHLIDDANIGLDPLQQTLMQMGLRAGLSKSEWLAAFTAIGLSAAGLRIVAAAVLDPEPTSKLGLLVAGGFLLTFCCGLTAIRILTHLKPPRVRMGQAGFEIAWD